MLDSNSIFYCLDLLEHIISKVIVGGRLLCTYYARGMAGKSAINVHTKL